MAKIGKRYSQAMIATDMVIFTIKNRRLNVLLIEMRKAPYQNHWAVPGGLVNFSESVDESAKRQLAAKTGVKNVYLEQLYTFGQVDRDPYGRVISVAYFALIPANHLRLQTTSEYGAVKWFSVEKLPELAYDHREIIKLAHSRLQAKLGYTNIIYSLLPAKFTLSEMQNFYEIILGKKLDKRNFRKKILSLPLVRPAGRQEQGVKNRPAELYRFTSRRPRIVQIM